MSLKTHNFAFGEFILDVGEKVLFRDSKPVSLTPKAFQLLLVLVQNHGHLIEKSELLNQVWPGSFVEEGNLTFTIGMLRKALGDSSQAPHLIETVPRRGYRFICEVSEMIETPTAIVQTPLVRAPALRISKLVFVGFCIVMVGALAGATWLARINLASVGNGLTVLERPFHSEKFPSAGKKVSAAISPDGRLTAYVDETDGKLSVWLRDLETLQNVLLIPPANELYFGVIFSHDGQTIYFVRKSRSSTERNSTSIYRVSILGGVPEKVVTFAEGWISLSPDDRRISFVRCPYGDDDYCSLLIADTDGQNERTLITLKRPFRISDNQFSPDGTSIAVASGVSENGGKDFHLTLVDVQTGTQTAIPNADFFNINSLQWLPDGRSFLVAAMERLDGQSKLWQVSGSTGEVRDLTKDAASYMSISLNRDASRMISTQFSNNFQLYFSSHDSTKILTGAREAVFASDGKLIYSTDAGDIWTMNHDGSNQRQLTSNVHKDFSPCSSPDGRFIYFTSSRSGSNQVWRMNSDGSEQIAVTKTEGGYPVFVSPDGRWVFFESGLHQTLWKVSTDTFEEVRIADEKVYRPAFSADGKYAAFFVRQAGKEERTAIAVINVADQHTIKTIELADPQSTPIMISWSGGSRVFTYVTRNDQGNSLWSQDIENGPPGFISNLGDKNVESYALAADGSYVYTMGEWLHDAILIDGLK